jgi:polysaccharide pyruvyl transferase WcaK-like protein
MREQDQPIRVCLYTCIPEQDEFKRQRYPLREKFKSTLKNAFNGLHTSLTNDLFFDTYSYMIANGLGDNSNRGDLAIRMAIRSQLELAFAPRPIHFLEVGWGRLTQQSINHINRHADLFVIAGGGYIFVNGDGSPGAMLAGSARLTELKCPVVAIGIGLNRVMHETTCSLSDLPSETRKKVEQLSSVCQEISVRDGDTAELFARYGSKPSTVIGDPVLYFNDGDTPTLSRSGPLKMGVNLATHGWRAYSVLKPMLPHIISTLIWIQNDLGAEITYFVHHDFERPVVKYLQKKGLRLKVIDGTPAQLIDAYKEVDFVINQMLHSCIFAANAGVPFLNLAYDRKSMAFCSLLDIQECAIEHSQVTRDILVKKLEDLLGNRSRLSKKIVEKRACLRSESRKFLDKVAKSIRNGTEEAS